MVWICRLRNPDIKPYFFCLYSCIIIAAARGTSQQDVSTAVSMPQNPQKPSLVSLVTSLSSPYPHCLCHLVWPFYLSVQLIRVIFLYSSGYKYCPISNFNWSHFKSVWVDWCCSRHLIPAYYAKENKVSLRTCFLNEQHFTASTIVSVCLRK